MDWWIAMSSVCTCLLAVVHQTCKPALQCRTCTHKKTYGDCVLRHSAQPTKIFRPGRSKVQNLSIRIREGPHPLFCACAVQMQELEGSLGHLGLQCIQGEESEQFRKKV